MNVHIITGPNGMCRCGEDGKTCSEILAGVAPKDLGSYLAGYRAALEHQGAVDNNAQHTQDVATVDNFINKQAAYPGQVSYSWSRIKNKDKSAQRESRDMVPCKFHYRCRSCTLGFKLSCPDEPCRLAQHQ